MIYRIYRLPTLGGLITAAALLMSAGMAQAEKFDGFKDQFNLGRSSVSGAVCVANRSYDDPLGVKARTWDVTCRGWGAQRLGRIYLFTGANAAARMDEWRADLAGRADCADAKAAGAAAITCKTKRPVGLGYQVMTSAAGAPRIAVEGMAGIGDILATAFKFTTGAINEPAAIAEQTASVSQVTGADVSALALAGDAEGASAENRRQEAYRRNTAWQFGDAEAIFSELAASSGDGAPSAATRAESLYNFALNVSNRGRFSEADVYFDQADRLARDAGPNNALSGVALNYRAAHARNQRHYDEAIKLAQAAIALRAEAAAAGAAVRDEGGTIRIVDGGAEAATGRLTEAQREALRDVQAYQIEATSLEALDRTDEARAVLQDQALPILKQPWAIGAGGRDLVLGDALPWLNVGVQADALRLNRNIGRAADSVGDFRKALNGFAEKNPESLPLAGFLIELARAEAAIKGQDDQALGDYERAFDIFRKQRGSTAESADLVGTYFDIILSRIGDAPAAHPQEAARFFVAAQTLIAQSSAEAAKRQAARIMSGNTAAAGLARALDDTGRSIDAKSAEIRDLQQRALYQGGAKTKADAELLALVDQSRTLEQQLLQADPGYASALRSVVGLNELQKVLQPDEVYVKVFVLANRGYGLLVTPTAVRPYPIELSRDQAAAMVDSLRKPIDRAIRLGDGRANLGRFDVALAHNAFLKLFGPIQSDILGAKHVIYEPDVTLIGLPISALVVDDASVATMQHNLDLARTSPLPLTYAGVNWLGAKVSSSIALSPAAFVQARGAAKSRAASPFFGFGDPRISQDVRAFAGVRTSALLQSGSSDFCARVRASLHAMPDLPQTAQEVKTVAASLGQNATQYALGLDFNDTNILRRGGADGDLSHYRVLYFATHGILPQETNGCVDAALVTSLGDAPSDALLDVKKIPKLTLDADMVVLSACDTGRHDGGGSDALGGLVSAFVQAGARNVVVSNWQVDTTATERLMNAMFQVKSVSQAEALAEAERSLMNSPDQYSHPYFWAPFTVVGDGARPMPAV